MKIGQGGGGQWRLGWWMVAVNGAGVDRRRWPAAVGGGWRQNSAQNRGNRGRQRRENRGWWRPLDAGECDGGSGDFRRRGWATAGARRR